MELYIIRHGLAGEHGSYANDDERPLTEEGIRKTKGIAKRLRALKLRFDLVQTSPLVRAKQTAQILQETKLCDQLQEYEQLSPGGKFDAWLSWLQQWKQPGKCLAIVGHEPDLSAWAEQLVWGEVRHQLILKKAGVIGLLLPDRGELVKHCQLFWLTPPRFLLDD